MSRHYSSRSYGGYGSSRRRTGADRFGILTFFLLLISSGFLAARLLTTGVLTQKLTLLLLSVLAGLNVLFAVTQLPPGATSSGSLFWAWWRWYCRRA